MCKIIIAEDEFLEREVLKQAINKHQNATLIGECDSGDNALNLATKLHCDVIFLNIKMGGTCGIETAKKIKKLNNSTKVVITSGHISQTNQKALNKIGVDHIMLKPYPINSINTLIDKFHLTSTSGPKLQNKHNLHYPNSLKSPHIIKAINYIDTHFKEQLTLESVAEAIYLSPFYLSRLFKKEVGVTLVSYIVYKKLEESKKMLKETNLPLSNISTYVGFSDQSYFSKVFKNSYGETPAKYRSSSKKISDDRKKLVEEYL